MEWLIERLFRADVDDPLVAQRKRLFYAILLIVAVANLIAALMTLIIGPWVPVYLVMNFIALLVFVLLYWFMRRGHSWPPYVLVAFLALLMPIAFSSNLADPMAAALIAPVTVGPLIAAPWVALPTAAIEAVLFYVLRYFLGYPPSDFMFSIIVVVIGLVSWLTSWSLERAFFETRRNAQALREANLELDEGRQLLEERSRDLARRTDYLEATAAIARNATSVLEMEELLARVVVLVRERFGFDHTALFLVDPTGEWAVLQASFSKGGAGAWEPGFRLSIDETTIVGNVIHRNAPDLILDLQERPAGASVGYPAARAELALPLRLRDEVIGVLDIQSEAPGAFSQDDVTALIGLADQVSVAINNARLFGESREALEAMRRAYGEVSQEAWQALLRARSSLGFRRNHKGTFSVGDLWTEEMEAALITGQVTAIERDPGAVVVPVKSRGQVVGVVEVRKSEPDGTWTTQQISMLETLSDQLGSALESARLYEDSLLRAQRERLVTEISDRLRASRDVEAVLQATVREFASVLNAVGTIRMMPQTGAGVREAPVQTDEPL